MATVQLNIQGSDQSGPSFKSAASNVQSLDNSVDRLTSRVTSLAGAMGVLYVGNKLWEGFTLGIKAVDDFQQSVIKTSAMITSLQGGENVADNYRRAKEYAEGLQDTLMKVDSNTSLNLTSLQSITEEMVKQGVILDTSNASQIEGFTRLANAAAVYSNNGRNEMQLRQEVSALLRGEVDQNSQLASMVQKMVQGPLQEQVNKWKQSGTLVEELGKALSGFGPASKDMAGTWSAVKSSLETSVNLILRGGFSEVVQDIVGYVGKLNEYLKENKDMIAGEIKKGWESFKKVAEMLVPVLKEMYDHAGLFVGLFVGGTLLKGLTSAYGLYKDILVVVRAIALTQAGTAIAGAGTAAGTIAGGVASKAGWMKYLVNPITAGLAAFGYVSSANDANDIDDMAKIKAFTGGGKYTGMAGAARVASGPATPVITPQESEEQYKKRIQEQEKELSAYKAMQDSKTAIAKASGEVELADLKQRYALGRITTQEYYDEENRISADSAYEKYSNAVDYYNKEVDLLNAIGAKKSTKSAEYQAELAKNAKADEAVQLAELEMTKAASDGETKLQDALTKRGKVYSELIAKAQEEAGQYVAAAETRNESDKKSSEYLLLRIEALKGVKGAVEALAAKEKEFAVQQQEALNKENEASRSRSEATSKLKDEWDAIIGKDRERIQVEAELRTAQNSLLSLQDQLTLATLQGNSAAISGLQQQIALQSQLNAHKQQSVTLSEQVGVLNGTITGFSNGAPVYADAYQREQAATGYQSPSAALVAAGGGSGSSSFTNGNAFPSSLNSPFMGGFAVGTNRVPFDGYAFLHKDEAVVPAAYNPAVGGQGAGSGITIQGGISIAVQGGNTAAETLDNIARQLLPKLQQLQNSRFRKAA